MVRGRWLGRPTAARLSRRSGDRGMVTVEGALALCSLVAVLGLLLAGTAVVTDHLRCVDAAIHAARALARGESETRVDGLVASLAPPGAELVVEHVGGTVSVRVTARPIGGALPGLTLNGVAHADIEPGITPAESPGQPEVGGAGADGVAVDGPETNGDSGIGDNGERSGGPDTSVEDSEAARSKEPRRAGAAAGVGPPTAGKESPHVGDRGVGSAGPAGAHPSGTVVARAGLDGGVAVDGAAVRAEGDGSDPDGVVEDEGAETDPVQPDAAVPAWAEADWAGTDSAGPTNDPAGGRATTSTAADHTAETGCPPWR